MEQLNPSARRDTYGKKINRDHSPVLVYGIPWLTIMLGSLTPMLPVIASAPVLPPFGLMFLVAWRVLRPGLIPLWAGFPLGLFDDFYSGQPLGSGILLFSCSLIALDLVEMRFPWRNFWQDWLIAVLVLTIYLVIAAVVSGAEPTLVHLRVIIPQLLLSVVTFPIVARMVSVLDRVRLMRVRRLR